MAKDKTNGAAPADDQIPDDDAPPGEEIEVQVAGDDIPPVPEPPPAAVSADEGIEALRANLDRERTGRLAAEARERAANERARNAGKEVQDTQLSMVTGAIASVTAESDRLEQDYAAALTDQDYAGAAKIQRAMSENAAKLQTLEGGKLQLEADAKRVQEDPRSEIDPVEALAAQLTPKSAAWVRSHPEYARDNTLYTKMIAAHNLAVADGISPDSDEYFSEIEGTLKIRRPAAVAAAEEENPLSAASEPSGRIAAPPPAAPVRGGGTLQNGRTPTTVRLSAAQREAAEMSGLSEIEYAKQLLAMEAEGKGH